MILVHNGHKNTSWMFCGDCEYATRVIFSVFYLKGLDTVFPSDLPFQVSCLIYNSTNGAENFRMVDIRINA